jgi:hypothetical protein
MSKQLLPIDSVTPARLGLNLQQKTSILAPSWATSAENCRLDDALRLAIRNGYSVTSLTPTGADEVIESLHEYLLANGTVETIFATDNNLYNNPTNPNSIKGGLTITDGRWYFQNFNNKCLGFQEGSKPIVYTGSTFATVVESSGTAPTSKDGIALCAYGRVWALDSDGQTIKYSGLLDETDWGSASSGQIDMSNIWTKGMDEVKAIAAFNGSFLVFGKNHIVIWEDGLGSQLGVSPTQLVVIDVIEGTGCVSHWTLQTIGESDMVFLSRNGLQSLGRVIQEKSNPLRTVSKYVRDDLLETTAQEDKLNLRSCYSPELGIYFLSVPSELVLYAFDVRNRVGDEEGDMIYPCFKWRFLNSGAAKWVPNSILSTQAGALVLGSNTGEVYTYGADSDNSKQIQYSYASPWLDLGEELGNRLKMLKRIGAIIFVRNNAGIEFKWATDFKQESGTVTKLINDPSSSEWNVAEWALGEWSGGLFLQIIKVPARDVGQYYQIKIETSTTGQFALQQLELFTKVGRIA